MTSTPVVSVEASPTKLKSPKIFRGLVRFFSEKNLKVYTHKRKDSEPLPLKQKNFRLSKTPTFKESDKQRTITELFANSLHAQRKHQYEQSLSYIDKVLLIDPKNSEAWNRKGYVCHICNRLSQAIECYDLAIKYSPKNAVALNNKGGVYLGMEKFQDALLCFNEALLIDPNYKVSWNNQGVTLRQMGNFKEALSCHEKALLLDNNDPLTLNQLGRVNFLLSDFSTAVYWFDKAIKIDPTYYQAIYGKGILLREMGDHENALTYFNKALSINPNYKEDHWVVSPTRTSISSKNYYDDESVSQIHDLSKSSDMCD